MKRERGQNRFSEHESPHLTKKFCVPSINSLVKFLNDISKIGFLYPTSSYGTSKIIKRKVPGLIPKASSNTIFTALGKFCR